MRGPLCFLWTGIRKTKVGIAILLVSGSHIPGKGKRLIKFISGATEMSKVVPRAQLLQKNRLLFQGKSPTEKHGTPKRTINRNVIYVNYK